MLVKAWPLTRMRSVRVLDDCIAWASFMGCVVLILRRLYSPSGCDMASGVELEFVRLQGCPTLPADLMFSLCSRANLTEASQKRLPLSVTFSLLRSILVQSWPKKVTRRVCYKEAVHCLVICRHQSQILPGFPKRLSWFPAVFLCLDIGIGSWMFTSQKFPVSEPVSTFLLLDETESIVPNINVPLMSLHVVWNYFSLYFTKYVFTKSRNVRSECCMT